MYPSFGQLGCSNCCWSALRGCSAIVVGQLGCSLDVNGLLLRDAEEDGLIWTCTVLQSELGHTRSTVAQRRCFHVRRDLLKLNLQEYVLGAVDRCLNRSIQSTRKNLRWLLPLYSIIVIYMQCRAKTVRTSLTESKSRCGTGVGDGD